MVAHTIWRKGNRIPNRGPRPLVNKSGLDPHVSALATDKRLATSSGRRDARPIHGGVSGERRSKSKRRSLGVVLRTYRPALADFPASPQMFRLTPVSVKSSWALEFSCLYLTTTSLQTVLNVSRLPPQWKFAASSVLPDPL